jgi:flagellar biogenesis protein FliO
MISNQKYYRIFWVGLGVALTFAFLPRISLASNEVSRLDQVELRSSTEKGAEFRLSFDHSLSQSQIQTEYLGDSIQITLKGVTVDPSQMVPVSSGLVSKVFAYQFAPKVVRCRISLRVSLREKIESLRKRTRISLRDKTMVVSLGSVGEESAEASTQSPVESRAANEEAALYERVLKVSRGLNEEKNPKPVKENAEIIDTVRSTQSAPENWSKPHRTDAWIYSLMKKVAFVLFGLLVIWLGVKRLGKARKGALREAFGSLLSRTAIGKDSKMIEVVSTHYLDPKKKIAVVRIAGRMLVLGVSQDSINLITQLGNESETGFDGEDSSLLSQSQFSQVLKKEEKLPPVEGVRSQIRSKMEGLKPL